MFCLLRLCRWTLPSECDSSPLPGFWGLLWKSLHPRLVEGWRYARPVCKQPPASVVFLHILIYIFLLPDFVKHPKINVTEHCSPSTKIFYPFLKNSQDKRKVALCTSSKLCMCTLIKWRWEYGSEVSSDILYYFFSSMLKKGARKSESSVPLGLQGWNAVIELSFW